MYKQEGQSWLVGHIHSVCNGVYVVGAAAELRLTKTKCLQHQFSVIQVSRSAPSLSAPQF